MNEQRTAANRQGTEMTYVRDVYPREGDWFGYRSEGEAGGSQFARIIDEVVYDFRRGGSCEAPWVPLKYYRAYSAWVDAGFIQKHHDMDYETLEGAMAGFLA